MTETLLLAIVIGFLFYEFTGISPGGVIAPGYFALSMHEPLRLGATLLVSLAVYGAVVLLARHLVIYGRRRLLLAILLGVCGKMLFEFFMPALLPQEAAIAVVGYVIPGLVANEMVRQKPLQTVSALAAVTAVTYLILQVARA